MNRNLLFAMAILPLFAPASATAEEGFSAAISIGRANLSEDFDGFDVSADSTAYRINLAYHWNEYLAVEGGYHNFGRFRQAFVIGGERTDIELKADGFTLGAVASWPLSGRFSLFARGGAYFWDGDADINDLSAATPEDTNLYVGGGLRFVLNERWSLTADATRYDLDGTTSTVASAGVEIAF